MRTRRANKTKRYTEYSLSVGDDEDGTEEPSQAGNFDDSDPEFAAIVSDNNLDDVSSARTDHESDPEHDLAELSDSGSDAGQPSKSKPKAPRGSSKPAAKDTATAKQTVGDYHELPVYPLDPRIYTRAYTGPLKRGARTGVLRDMMYGPEYSKIKLIWDLLERWARYPVLPARHPPQHPEGVLPSPWLPPGFELKQEDAACKWYDSYVVEAPEAARSHPVPAKNGERLVPQPGGHLAVVMGPPDGQKEYLFSPGTGMALSASSLPVNEPDNPDSSSNGWMFDVGGIITALGWAPISSREKQALALSVIPHSDQIKTRGEPGVTVEDKQTTGCIQFWEFDWEHDKDGGPLPSRSQPRFTLTKCFDWGRPKRMQWCPVSFSMAGLQGLLAVLCDDGRVRVLDVKDVEASDTTVYEWIESPVATLGFTDNYNVEATSFAWIGCNRITLGHTDGSITLWSIHPTQILQRHAVHASHVLDMSSGYPSMPHMLASIPVGGFATLVDLSNPTSECTYLNAPSINFQPGNLEWNDHLQGWLALAPSGGPGLNTLVFLHVRYFPLARSMVTTMSMPLCVSFRGNHPYGLVGCADGSVWSFNAMSKLFKQRGEDAFKVKLLEHEFRPVDAFRKTAGAEESGDGRLRGASRFLHGFYPEVNDDPRAERLRQINKKKPNASKKTAGKGKKKGRSSAKSGPTADGYDVEEGMGQAADRVSAHTASRLVVHEPLTRVSAIAWNPNVQFATWAAVALGSGLVRVVDIGVE